jgi:hypothetical protein
VSEPEIRGGRLRGMGPQATIEAPPHDATPRQANDGQATAGDDLRSVEDTQGETDKAAPERREPAVKGGRNPYAGERKIQVNPRLFPSLWAQYEQLAVEIRQAGGRATVTDLVNAVLHYRGPDNAQDAHALLNRFRALTSQD